MTSNASDLFLDASELFLIADLIENRGAGGIGTTPSGRRTFTSSPKRPSASGGRLSHPAADSAQRFGRRIGVGRIPLPLDRFISAS